MILLPEELEMLRLSLEIYELSTKVGRLRNVQVSSLNYISMEFAAELLLESSESLLSLASCIEKELASTLKKSDEQ